MHFVLTDTVLDILKLASVSKFYDLKYCEIVK